MKTLILSFLLIFGEEVYVNDIPFDTEAIAGQYLQHLIIPSVVIRSMCQEVHLIY